MNEIKKNDEFDVVVTRLGAEGEGIAEKDGKVVFVPFVLPSERANVHVVKVKPKFLIAKLKTLKSASSQRVSPPCKYYFKCGGCDIQHMSYDCQLELKKQKVGDCLKRIAGIQIPVPEIVASPKQFRYRNKFAFPVREENDEIKIGMFRKNSHDVIDIDDCLLQNEKTQKIVILFKKFMQKNRISAFNEKKGTGIVKHIVVRESGGEFILTIVVTDEKFDNYQPLVELFKSEFESFGIYKNVNKLNNNVIFGDKDIHIYGLKELEKNEFDIKYFVNNRSFLQVNDDIKNLIYKKIIEFCAGQKIIIDAYSGAGLLSAILAKNSERVIGIEIIKEATQNADFLKKINNLNNLTNKNGDCTKILPELAKSFSEDFAVIVDPPRKGLEKRVVDVLIETLPQKIIYLSCDPATLARDLKILAPKYNIEYIEAFDMFPQTANVETLVCLETKGETKNGK